MYKASDAFLLLYQQLSNDILTIHGMGYIIVTGL